ncbi:uncharacterized protein BDZ99DRAFT_430136 [Mytilinidion resinicola]|uniref:ABM domain-containing protein n=1 Tax=Mytilinidion resinicola TaxID=574789 RepID=A0A6A6XZZ3_9PEZI|nr:uncharacterized protein BDZ99DRAFT_430136 [Mytilinidion resinicola]KAF2801314.1 hypothetical protein BDZ99DRAFT_430136 [Mytilinidion resinicola]
MAAPKYYVVARVVSRDGALDKWRERLTALCAVSKTEPFSNSYYWGYDLDGAPDTLWGLEGYYHPVGFHMNHVSGEIFKEEMAKVDDDKLLRNVQGLGSPDYDLHHYDLADGFVKRKDDPDADAVNSVVVIVHFWAKEGKRKQLLGTLADAADRVQASEKAGSITVQSFAVLKEVNDFQLATAYIRTKTLADWEKLANSSLFKELLDGLETVVAKQEIHRAQNFIGHIDQDAPIGNP